MPTSDDESVFDTEPRQYLMLNVLFRMQPTWPQTLSPLYVPIRCIYSTLACECHVAQTTESTNVLAAVCTKDCWSLSSSLILLSAIKLTEWHRIHHRLQRQLIHIESRFIGGNNLPGNRSLIDWNWIKRLFKRYNLSGSARSTFSNENEFDPQTPPPILSQETDQTGSPGYRHQWYRINREWWIVLFFRLRFLYTQNPLSVYRLNSLYCFSGGSCGDDWRTFDGKWVGDHVRIGRGIITDRYSRIWTHKDTGDGSRCGMAVLCWVIYCISRLERDLTVKLQNWRAVNYVDSVSVFGRLQGAILIAIQWVCCVVLWLFDSHQLLTRLIFTTCFRRNRRSCHSSLCIAVWLVDNSHLSSNDWTSSRTISSYFSQQTKPLIIDFAERNIAFERSTKSIISVTTIPMASNFSFYSCWCEQFFCTDEQRSFSQLK